MPKVQTNGITLNYEERGSGPPLILIMGITADHSVWEAHVEDWSRHFRCIMPDNRGVGLSDKPAGAYSSAEMADDIAGLMDELGIESAKVVGCSMGSIITQQLAIRHPQKVEAAVLMCTWARCDAYAKSVFNHMETIKARLTPPEFMGYIQLLIFGKKHWDENAADLAEGRKDALNQQIPQPLVGLSGQAHACRDHDVYDRLGEITCPTLVIGGEDDIFTPRWMSEEVHAALPNSELYLYPDAGHGFHFENIEDFNQRVRGYLLAPEI